MDEPIALPLPVQRTSLEVKLGVFKKMSSRLVLCHTVMDILL